MTREERERLRVLLASMRLCKQVALEAHWPGVNDALTLARYGPDGGDFIQFPTENDAQLFVAAVNALPALLDALDAAEGGGHWDDALAQYELEARDLRSNCQVHFQAWVEAVARAERAEARIAELERAVEAAKATVVHRANLAAEQDVHRLHREKIEEWSRAERAEARIAELERERDRLRAFRDAVMAWNKAMTVKALSQRYGRVSAEGQSATDRAWDAVKAAIAAEKEGT
jgi:hypothetical protein